MSKLKIDYKESLLNAQKYIAQLEKENAELKAELEENKDLPAIAYQQGAEWWKKKADQKLAQAKEHIKLLLDCLKQDTNDPQTNYYVCQYMDKAEQFLKE